VEAISGLSVDGDN